MSGVFELRQYTLHSGERDRLIELFDREFVESQEVLGMQVVGQFRDLDDPNRFVWMRGFADMARRHEALSAFYGGPVWAEHRSVANATMLDFDDVLLLRPVAPEAPFPRDGTPRPPVGADRPPSLVTATIHRLTRPPGADVLGPFMGRIDPLLDDAGAARVALLQTEPAPNTFTPLPVREGEHVLVRIARFDDADAHAGHLRRLQESAGWEPARRELAAHLLTPPQELRLQPTARSLLR